MDIKTKEHIEIEAWKLSKTENSSEFTVSNLINKVGNAEIFCSILDHYRDHFQRADIILEIGGGQGWASCIIKKEFEKNVITTDISPYALESLKYWEDIFKVRIDKYFSAKSYDISLENNTIDLVFCFAAAHHFIKHRKTLKELNRILRHNGIVIYMYEPACRNFFYKWAFNRVNRIRPDVPEDVLKYKELIKIGEQEGFKVTVDFFPSTIKRGLYETFYYYILSKIPILTRILPCSVNIVFEKFRDVNSGS